MIRQIVVQIKSGKVATLLLFDFLDMEFGKDHSAFWMVRMRQRIEPQWPQIFSFYIHWGHFCELFPGDTLWEFHSHPFLDRFCPSGHHLSLSRSIAQIVPLIEQVHLALHHRRFGVLHARHGF